MASADRAINLALRVLGIGEVERDFKRVGDAGNKSFADIKKSAKGAALEVSEYTARLRGAVAEAKRMADQNPLLNKPTRQSRTDRGQFVLGAVRAEQERMLKGMPDVTGALGQAETATTGLAGALGRLAAPLAIAYGGFMLLRSTLGPLVEAQIEHEKALAAFNATIALTGNKSRATAADIRAMAEAVAQSTDQSADSALAAGQVLAQVAGLSADAFGAAMQASALYADSVSKDLPDVIKGITAPVLQALANRDMKALLDATKGLDDPLRELILNLAEAGRTADAQRALFAGLAQAAGDGPGGLAGATAHLSASWADLQAKLADNGPFRVAGAMVEWLAGKLDGLTDRINRTRINWGSMLGGVAQAGLLGTGGGPFIQTDARPGETPGGRAMPKGGRGGGRAKASDPNRVSDGPPPGTRPLSYFEGRYGGGGKRGGGGSRPRGGGGESAAAKAKREAERLEREAKQAEDAAARIAEANQDVVTSWTQRAADVTAKIGLEGDALKLEEKRQARETAMRQINVDLLEKEAEAARKRAAVPGMKNREAGALGLVNATGEIERQRTAVGELSDEYFDAQEKIALFNRRQSESKALLEELKSPFDKINDEIENAIELLKGGFITIDQFNDRMKQLAYDMADARHELDEGAKAWEGFGQEVGRSLADVVLNGGNALDILQQLIRMPLERILEQQLVNPVANFIDGLTGNNREKDASGIYGGMRKGAAYLGDNAVIENPLDPASAAAAASTTHLATSAELAAAAVMRFAAAMNAGGAGGAGGGGGFLQLLGAIVGGGTTAGEVARLTPDALSTIAANPGVFAGGTPNVPVGHPFYVGDNGREMMRYHAGGRLEVINGPQTHRMAQQGGGGVTLVQNITVPERVDPRRTSAGIARSTQGALMRASRKGLAGTRS